MTNATHTPLPWAKSTASFNETAIYSGNVCVADVYGKDKRANAAFIVKACNSHYDLLEYAKENEWLLRNLLTFCNNDEYRQKIEESINSSVAAIAKAEGK